MVIFGVFPLIATKILTIWYLFIFINFAALMKKKVKTRCKKKYKERTQILFLCFPWLQILLGYVLFKLFVSLYLFLTHAKLIYRYKPNSYNCYSIFDEIINAGWFIIEPSQNLIQFYLANVPLRRSLKNSIYLIVMLVSTPYSTKSLKI